MKNVIELKFLNTNFKKLGRLGTKFQKCGPHCRFVKLGTSSWKWGLSPQNLDVCSLSTNSMDCEYGYLFLTWNQPPNKTNKANPLFWLQKMNNSPSHESLKPFIQIPKIVCIVKVLLFLLWIIEQYVNIFEDCFIKIFFPFLSYYFQELHAHLNGSLSQITFEKLKSLKREKVANIGDFDFSTKNMSEYDFFFFSPLFLVMFIYMYKYLYLWIYVIIYLNNCKISFKTVFKFFLPNFSLIFWALLLC